MILKIAKYVINLERYASVVLRDLPWQELLVLLNSNKIKKKLEFSVHLSLVTVTVLNALTAETGIAIIAFLLLFYSRELVCSAVAGFKCLEIGIIVESKRAWMDVQINLLGAIQNSVKAVCLDCYIPQLVVNIIYVQILNLINPIVLVKPVPFQIVSSADLR